MIIEKINREEETINIIDEYLELDQNKIPEIMKNDFGHQVYIMSSRVSNYAYEQAYKKAKMIVKSLQGIGEAKWD